MEHSLRPRALTGTSYSTFSSPIVVRVALECPDGECWLTIGGGATLEKALDSALRSAPAQKRWRVAGWNEYSGPYSSRYAD